MNRNQRAQKKKDRRDDRQLAASAQRAQGRLIDCHEHGTSRWTGQVACAKCEAVWHLNDPPVYAKCTCGANLIGEGGSARVICGRCYDIRKATIQ